MFGKKGLGKMSKKLQSSMPGFKQFAVDNDQGYFALINILKEINVERLKKKKVVIKIS